MTNRLLWFALLLCAGLLLAPVEPAHAQMRWAALLQNGEVVQGNSLTEWHIAPGTPKIDGREVLHADNPFLWICDRHSDRTPAGLPRAYVEFAQGDILPGEVTGWRSSSPSPYDTQEEYFIVRTQELLGMGADNANPEVRISPKYARRIVWQPLANTALKPGTLFYRNGRQLEFRSWRGGANSITVLTTGGLQQVAFEEIAELHLPAPDFWESYCDEVAALLPSGEGRLCTIRTMAGMMATGSLSQLQVQPGAPANQPDQWIHGIQPIWSLDPLWIRGATIWLRQSYLPTELPLNKLSPTEEVETDLLGSAPWPWQRDLNVQGGKMDAGGLPYGWGFGVHAPSRLQVQLPAAAQSLKASVAIDDITEAGGCVQARVLAGSDRRVLFESPLLTGESAAAAIGPLDLSGLRISDGVKTIIFEVDPAVHNRPEGADPLDIRDHVDWLDPRVELDAAALAAEVESRFPKFVRVWEGWDVDMQQPELLTITHAAVEPSPTTSRGLFRYATTGGAANLVLSQDLPATTGERWLLISAHVTDGNGARLEIRADGLAIANYELPTYDAARQAPGGYILPLSPLEGIAKRIEIAVLPRAGATAISPIVWKSVRFIDQLPMVYAMFGDDPGLLTAKSQEVSEIVTDETLVHSGTAALRIPAGETVELLFPQTIMIDAEPDWGEYRYMQFALRKQGGMASIEFLHTGEEGRVLAYEAGAGNSTLDDSVRVWTLELGGDWVVITRDLYSDFGHVELTGVKLTSLGGDFALFDQVLLSRRSDGFNSMPETASAEYVARAQLLREAEPATFEVMAATAHLAVEDRHTMGLCVDPEGYLVTSGDIAGGVGREAQVYFRGRPETKAVVHGIDREHNLALWKMAEPGPWPAANLASSPAAAATRMVGLTYPVGEQWQPLGVTLGEVGPTDDRFLNATSDPPGGTMEYGGVLVGLDGQVIGVARARKPDSTFSYTQASVLAGQLARLKQGGAYGSWEPNRMPHLGLTVTPVEGGLQITAVEGNTPAATVGLQVNDILTKFDGQAVTSVESYEALLRQRDINQTLTLEAKRGEEVLNVTPTLTSLPF